VHFDVIVVGAGAAGLMCAIEAGKRGRRVAVLENNSRAGSKILISGGGRCNFTNRQVTARNFLSDNPHFAKSALARYTPADFIALIERHGIRYHEKTLGQLFCDESARQVTEMLLAECRAASVDVRTSCPARDLRKADEFVVDTAAGEMQARTVVIASGGLSIPKMGATDFAYRIARRFGLRVVECRPALVPLVLNDDDRARYCDLAGVSADVIAATGGAIFREKMLITHQGLSGPAILQASSYWRPGQAVALTLAPDHDLALEWTARKKRGERGALKTILADHVPKRLAERLAPAGQTLNQISDRELAAAAAQLQPWVLTPAGTEGYAKAEVTAGGIDTSELSSKTFESHKVRGLYFIGEAVDVTGHLGGFNFQWAWASGYCAGQFV